MTSRNFLISKLAADLDTTNYEVMANDALMKLLDDYLADTEMSYYQVLEIAHKFKQAMRR